MIFLLPRITDFLDLPLFIAYANTNEFESSSDSWYPYIKEDGTPHQTYRDDDRELRVLSIGEYRFLGLKLGDIYQVRGPLPNE